MNQITDWQVDSVAKAIADCHNPGSFELYPDNWRAEARAALEAAARVPEQGEATAAIERVRAIHIRDEHGLCVECSWEYPETSYDAMSNDVSWPCPTATALDGAPEPEVKQ